MLNRARKSRGNATCFLDSTAFRMKRITLITILAAAAFLLTPAIAQTPTQKETDDLNALIKEVQAQQAEIVENQAKIEEKLAALSETIREARIFSSRGGR
jgi:septal ring factor EnvC (AmiA/AmiB activator)